LLFFEFYRIEDKGKRKAKNKYIRIEKTNDPVKKVQNISNEITKIINNKNEI
jgi:hypothetical protein